jgi:hypothetical protein
MKLIAATKSGASALATALLISTVWVPTIIAADAIAPAAGGTPAIYLGAVAAPANWNDQTGQTALVVRGDGSRLSIPNHSLLADSEMRFHRLQVNPSERMRVQVFGPEIPAGAKAIVVALDGGQLEEAQGSQFFEFTVGADKKIPFTFTAGQTAGLHRVAIRFGNQERLFKFWVGPELPVIVRSPSVSAQP